MKLILKAIGVETTSLQSVIELNVAENISIQEVKDQILSVLQVKGAIKLVQGGKMLNKGNVRDYNLTDGSTLQYAFRKASNENDVNSNLDQIQKPLVSDLQDPCLILSQPVQPTEGFTLEMDEIEKIQQDQPKLDLFAEAKQTISQLSSNDNEFFPVTYADTCRQSPKMYTKNSADFVQNALANYQQNIQNLQLQLHQYKNLDVNEKFETREKQEQLLFRNSFREIESLCFQVIRAAFYEVPTDTLYRIIHNLTVKYQEIRDRYWASFDSEKVDSQSETEFRQMILISSQMLLFIYYVNGKTIESNAEQLKQQRESLTSLLKSIQLQQSYEMDDEDAKKISSSQINYLQAIANINAQLFALQFRDIDEFGDTLFNAADFESFCGQLYNCIGSNKNFEHCFIQLIQVKQNAITGVQDPKIEQEKQKVLLPEQMSYDPQGELVKKWKEQINIIRAFNLPMLYTKTDKQLAILLESYDGDIEYIINLLFQQ